MQRSRSIMCKYLFVCLRVGYLFVQRMKVLFLPGSQCAGKIYTARVHTPPFHQSSRCEISVRRRHACNGAECRGGIQLGMILNGNSESHVT
jgi:hypothetical protein